jgi:hypothetical protein
MESMNIFFAPEPQFEATRELFAAMASMFADLHPVSWCHK